MILLPTLTRIIMFQILTICVLALTASLHSEQRLLTGNVSPSPASQSDAASEDGNVDDNSDGDDWSGTGEVDEDVIIMDDEDTNDDEGVNN